MNDDLLVEALLRERMTGMPRWHVGTRSGQPAAPIVDDDITIRRRRAELQRDAWTTGEQAQAS